MPPVCLYFHYWSGIRIQHFFVLLRSGIGSRSWGKVRRIWIKILVEVVSWIWILAQEQKWPTKIEKSEEISCFEVLYVLFWSLNPGSRYVPYPMNLKCWIRICIETNAGTYLVILSYPMVPVPVTNYSQANLTCMDGPFKKIRYRYCRRGKYSLLDPLLVYRTVRYRYRYCPYRNRLKSQVLLSTHFYQCCGTGTYCLSGTGIEMHYCSGSDFRTLLDPDPT